MTTAVVGSHGTRSAIRTQQRRYGYPMEASLDSCAAAAGSSPMYRFSLVGHDSLARDGHALATVSFKAARIEPKNTQSVIKVLAALAPLPDSVGWRWLPFTFSRSAAMVWMSPSCHT